MKILLVNAENMGGVEYYRMMAPALMLAKKYPEFDITSCSGINRDTMEIVRETGLDTGKTKEHAEPLIVPIDDFLKQFDLVHFCRGIDMFNEPNNADRLNRLGIPFGLDLDDYWEMPKGHILAKDYRLKRQDEAIVQSIKAAHFVTCTTPILAREIEQYNKNVYVIENGIDDTAEAWLPDFSKANVMRFGFYQGSTHMEDIKLASDDVVRIFDSGLPAQIVLSGFMAGKVSSEGEFERFCTEYFNSIRLNPESALALETKKDLHVKYTEGSLIAPSYYIGFEQAITNNLKVIKNPAYKEYLMKCISDNNHEWMNENYWRVWGTHVKNWGYTYNFCDVSLVPLVHNKFNKMKSELKLIEAGFKGKACIVSDVNPYKLLATDKNSFLVKGINTWYKQMKYCIENPNAVTDKANQLHEDVKAKYRLWDLVDKRKMLYEMYKA